ncbi:hypothetical protein, partial [Xenorhabdus bovienii]|uniref:hypothetical protein n=1 Tax=Xenorhabdus bovienii TaxID=40576 RepID=UPI0023B3112C
LASVPVFASQWRFRQGRLLSRWFDESQYCEPCLSRHHKIRESKNENNPLVFLCTFNCFTLSNRGKTWPNSLLTKPQKMPTHWHEMPLI